MPKNLRCYFCESSDSTNGTPASGIGVPRSRSRLRIVVVTVAVIAVVIVAVLIYFFPLFGTGDTTVGEQQLVKVTVNGVEYSFTKGEQCFSNSPV